jgi:MYXO-CTERM domain-containing protein
MSGAGGAAGGLAGAGGAAGAVGAAGAAGGTGLPITGNAGSRSVAGAGGSSATGTLTQGNTAAGTGAAGTGGVVLNIPPIPALDQNDGGCSAVPARGAGSSTAAFGLVALSALGFVRRRRARTRLANRRH